MCVFMYLHVCLHYSYKESSKCVLPPAVSCGHVPNAPENGQRRGSGTTFGSTVTYSCDPGYTLQGSTIIYCMANRQWNGSAPSCNGKLLCIYTIGCVLSYLSTSIGRYAKTQVSM